MARLSIVTLEMSSTSAMPSAQPDTSERSMSAADGSPACEGLERRQCMPRTVE